jgi:pilus assembly protein Flp/PilA
MKTRIKTFLGDKQGATAVEFALICGFILIGLIGAAKGLGEETKATWDNVSTKSINAMASQ